VPSLLIIAARVVFPGTMKAASLRVICFPPADLFENEGTWPKPMHPVSERIAAVKLPGMKARSFIACGMGELSATDYSIRYKAVECVKRIAGCKPNVWHFAHVWDY
jgi:hypothetical protein